MLSKTFGTLVGAGAVLAAMLGIAFAVAPVVTLDSPSNGFTTTDRSVDLVATVTDADADSMTVSFYGGTSDPPTDLLYVEEDVPSGTQLTYTWENPVLGVTAPTVAMWHFDEGSGSTASDASGNGNHGTINNATWTSDGKFGSALEFDGENDYVRVLDDPSLDLIDNVTVIAWVKGRGAGFTSVVREPGGGYAPQLQVIGDKIYYVFSNSSQIFTAEMNTDGTGWTATQRTTSGGSKHHPQFQVAGDSLWTIWRQQTGGYWQHYVGVMNIDGTGWSDVQVSTDLEDHF
jgi:hypothetical protein